MKFGIFADAHLRGKDWEDKKRVLTTFAAQLKSKGVKCLINLGDLFDQGKIGDKYASVGSIHSWLSSWLTDLNIPMISIEGNHDQTSVESAYDVLHHPLQVVVKNEVRWISIEDQCFICVPWLTQNRTKCDAREYARRMIVECYKDAYGRPELATFHLIGHLDAVGAQIRNHVAISSEEYSRYAFDLKKLYESNSMAINNTFLGHIHQRQPINVKKDFTHEYHGYVGYLAPLGFGETANQNGWCLYDSETELVEFIDLAAPRYLAKQTLSNKCSPYKDHYRITQEDYDSWGKELQSQGHHVEVISDKLDLEVVKNYIQAKDSSFKEVFNQWLEFTELALDDRSIIDEFIDALNIKWDSLTGKLSRVKSVELVNVGPHERFRADYEDGFTVILGVNGRGKSWCAEAPIFAAFGDWPTKRGTASSYMGKDSKVEVVLEIEGEDYRVVRTLKDMTVFDGRGVALTKELKRSSREWLEQRLGDKENFINCCFVAQSSQDYDIIKCDPSARMQMLRYFLKLDIFDAYWDEVKQLLSESIEELKEANESLTDEPSFNRELDQARNELGELLQAQVANRDEYAHVSSLINEHIDSYQVEKQHNALRTKLEMKGQSFEKLSLNASQIQTSLENLGEPADVSHLEEEAEILKKKIKSAEAISSRYTALKMVMNGSSLESAGCAPNHLSCPLIDKYVETQKQISLLPDKSNTDTELSILNRDLRRLTNDINESKDQAREIASLMKLLSGVNKQIYDLNSELINLNNQLSELNYEPIEVNVGDLMARQEVLNKANSVIIYKQGQQSARIARVEKELEKLAQLKKLVPSLKFRVDSYTVLEKAFNKNGVAHYLASSALPELQEIFNSLLNISFDDRLKIVFDNVAAKNKQIKESFSILKVNGRNIHDVRHCSGGEKAVLQLLWKLTLLIYQSRRNEGYRCLTLDEPTAWLDDDNVEATIKLLKYVAESFDQILLITHDQELANSCDQKIVLD